jgi:hypothetical protein
MRNVREGEGKRKVGRALLPVTASIQKASDPGTEDEQECRRRQQIPCPPEVQLLPVGVEHVSYECEGTPAVKGHPPFPEHEQMLDAVIEILPEVEPVQDAGSVNG